MIALSSALRSSIGKKFIMALTGLVWFGFVVGHLIGNMLLLVGREPFNNYAELLETLGHGALLPLAEAFLVLTLLSHVVTGIQVALSDKNRARPQGYAVNGNAGGRSQKTLASKTMIVTGSLILLFIIVHVSTFKFGVLQPTEGGAYIPAAAPTAKDLYARVVNAFANPLYVGFYTFIMLLLGTHLSHGIWSACQSLGLNSARFMTFLRPFAYVTAFVLAVGFLFLPVSIFVMNQQFASPKGGLFP